jgi:cyclic pyranopterin phosphate synthase
MPEHGVELMEKKDILSLEEMAEVISVGASRFGIKKIRFTGGEPLLRKGILWLVEQVSSIKGIEETTMTTNGMLLAQHAGALKKAGLSRVNISCDSLSPVKFRFITRGGDVERVKDGIKAARAAGLTPIKINVVRTEYTESEDLEALQEYCKKNQLEIRYIHQMNLKAGSFSRIEGGSGGHCAQCNRLRLMSNGDIKPCLFSDLGFNVRKLGIENAFLSALEGKPLEGKPLEENSGSNHQFYNIGG